MKNMCCTCTVIQITTPTLLLSLFLFFLLSFFILVSKQARNEASRLLLLLRGRGWGHRRRLAGHDNRGRCGMCGPSSITTRWRCCRQRCRNHESRYRVWRRGYRQNNHHEPFWNGLHPLYRVIGYSVVDHGYRNGGGSKIVSKFMNIWIFRFFT